MSADDYSRFAVAVGQAQAEHPEWRHGQTCFNVLYRQHPGLANTVRGSQIDPFHRQEVVPAFLSWVHDRLADP